ncbi:MAG: hypothetical protein MJ070_07870 [Lachnospiraceae bacterium]|nr:hypothetical protein [Lachnospiraceae bacterium]
MQLLIIVLNKTELLEEVLEALEENGVRGATIIDSKGMASELYDHDEFRIIASLRLMLNPEHKQNKTIFMVVEDEKVALVSSIVNKINGGFDKPDTGILFTVPVSYAEGLNKKQ